MSSRKELVELFRELTELLTLDEGGPSTFRVRAYENATEALKSTREPLEEMTVSKLTKLEGIGKSTAQKIREYYDTGRIERLEELRAKFPADFVMLARVPGLGPKTLLRLRDELQVANLDDLRAAIAAQKIRPLKGMGAKSEKKLAKAIERIGSKQDRRPIAEALPLAETLVEEVAALPGVEAVQYAGSLRRFRETIADIDLVVASRDAEPIMEFFANMGRVSEVLGRGGTKSSVVTNTGIQVDLRVVEPEQYGAALLYFTGSKAHNIRLRGRALDLGATLNEYGLVELETEKVLASKTEEDIYKALGMQFIAPPLREDHGEVAAAAENALPNLVATEDLRGDLHVHTSYSGDAKSSVAEVVEAASKCGYQYLAITDHGKDLHINGVDEVTHAQIAEEIAALGPKYSDMLLLHGCELNIGKEGELDYSEEQRAKFDLCVASIHSHFDLAPEAQTERLITAMKAPSVRILGHMLARSIGKREGIECGVDAVLEAAKEANVAIEINSGLTRLDAPVEVLRRACEIGNVFAVSSDAHHADHLSSIRFGVRHSHRGWVPRERIVNYWPLAKFKQWLDG
ncbi:MAG: DNA polymerase/3'-5' exonuclease PolX [Myxococcales bacterium]|nr:DNA polymerase/3'-5' exonuclease PolX [Myxococcales bacterium]